MSPHVRGFWAGLFMGTITILPLYLFGLSSLFWFVFYVIGYDGEYACVLAEYVIPIVAYLLFPITGYVKAWRFFPARPAFFG